MLYPNFSAFSLPLLMQTPMMVDVLKALPKQAAEAARERASPESPFLDVYGIVIDDAIAKPLTAIR
jgi:hypothetical protein